MELEVEDRDGVGKASKKAVFSAPHAPTWLFFFIVNCSILDNKCFVLLTLSSTVKTDYNVFVTRKTKTKNFSFKI